MDTTLIFIWGAFIAGIVHTVLGPDHYIPFIALAKSRSWSVPRTVFWTVLCGIGHLASAIVIAFGFIYLGEWLTASRIDNIEELRGDIAAWLLMGVGLAYVLWGLRHALRSASHTHTHTHDGQDHDHPHTHETHGHRHWHDRPKQGGLLPWVIFIIFAFGPCEALIPLLTAGIAGGIPLLVTITLVFSAATIGTMLFFVLLGYFGLSLVRLPFLERYAHAIAGATILICGILIYFVGL